MPCKVDATQSGRQEQTQREQTWKECMRKMSVEVSMVKRQLAAARGTLSYAPTLPLVAMSAALAAQSSEPSSMLSLGAHATAVPAHSLAVNRARTSLLHQTKL